MRYREIIREAVFEVFGDPEVIDQILNRPESIVSIVAKRWIDLESKITNSLKRAPLDIDIVLNLYGNTAQGREKVIQKYSQDLGSKAIFVLNTQGGDRSPAWAQSIWLMMHDIGEMTFAEVNHIFGSYHAIGQEGSGQTKNYFDILLKYLTECYSIEEPNNFTDQQLESIHVPARAASLMLLQVLTMKHARILQDLYKRRQFSRNTSNNDLNNNNIINPLNAMLKEEIIEMFVQYMLTGNIKLNPFPQELVIPLTYAKDETKPIRQINNRKYSNSVKYVLNDNAARSNAMARELEYAILKELKPYMGKITFI